MVYQAYPPLSPPTHPLPPSAAPGSETGRGELRGMGPKAAPGGGGGPRLAVGVSVKVRPQQLGEGPSCVTVGPGTRVAVPGGDFSYGEHALGGSDQQRAFEALGLPLVGQLRAGFDCTLLVYGQTGSGKTYTMFGSEGSLTEASLEAAGGGGAAPPAWGLMPRVLLEMLALGRAVSGSRGRESLHASVIEIYQDSCYDLLNEKKPLKVGNSAPLVHSDSPEPNGRHLGPRAPVVQGINAKAALHGAHPPACQCMRCFEANKAKVAARIAKRDAAAAARGAGRRRSAGAGTSHETASASFKTVGEELWKIEEPRDVAKLSRLVEAHRSSRGHDLNERSSRSHCIVRVHFSQKKPGGGGLTTSRFLFADLAGSERIGRSGMVSGEGRLEATSINSSLTALGKVINALVERRPHVPYRESTLTMLLRDSLAGRAAMRAVVCVSSGVYHAEESLCSLRYGGRLARVKSAPTRALASNAEGDASALRASLECLKAEMEDLEARGQGGCFGDVGVPSERRAYQNNRARFRKEQAAVASLKEEILEARAGGGGVARLAGLQQRLRRAEAEASNYHDILQRQEMIRGFWVPPSPAFAKKEAARQALEAKLRLLSL